jgi:isoquinoline 1-oxidoreductase subunit alpha
MKLRVNGREHDLDLPDDTPLLWALRDGLGMSGTKYGCGMALCGACTVHVDGVATRSCVTPLAAVAGREVLTIEGLSEDASHPVQRAWIEADVAQCGYCQSGQIMGALALLNNNPAPDDAAIIAAMDGHLCRCGTYSQVREAVKLAAQKMKEPQA